MRDWPRSIARNMWSSSQIYYMKTTITLKIKELRNPLGLKQNIKLDKHRFECTSFTDVTLPVFPQYLAFSALAGGKR